MSVYTELHDELEKHEFAMGLERGRLAVALDVLTDALVLVGQHGVYCQSARQPGRPAMDIQMITRSLDQAKELVSSVMDELRRKSAVQYEESHMATLGLIEYAEASPEVRAVYDDIMVTRQTDYVNNFWKALAHDPVTLRRTWESIKQIMAPGALDPLTKEMIYVAVSVTNQCGYCIASHTASARKAGMTDRMFGELMAVIGMANETNRLASGWQMEIDERFRV